MVGTDFAVIRACYWVVVVKSGLGMRVRVNLDHLLSESLNLVVELLSNPYP